MVLIAARPNEKKEVSVTQSTVTSRVIVVVHIKIESMEPSPFTTQAAARKSDIHPPRHQIGQLAWRLPQERR